MKTLCAFICLMGILSAAEKPPVIKQFEVDEFNNLIKALSKDENERRSQIIADKIEYLRLECHADYPVQWVYSGHGVPISNTDLSPSARLSTTERRRDGLDDYDYVASLFLGPLKEHHTGKYRCSRTDIDTTKPNLYVYVPGRNLFTSTRGQIIEITPSVTSKLVPCSVTHPDVEVTVYKLEGGDYTPVARSSDANTFDPRKGLRVNLKNVKNPEGRYICSGRYRGLHQDVEYTFEIAQSDQAAPGQLQEPKQPECKAHTDCPAGMRCQVGNVCYDACDGRCGTGSKCKVVGADKIPSCYCPEGYSGEASVACVRDP